MAAVIASEAKQSMARHRQINNGLLRRFAPRNDVALIQGRISRRRNRPARKHWQPSLRAQRSNPWLDIARSTMDCFVASAPRNDVALIQRRISRRRNRPARKQWQPSLRAKRSNPWLDIARSTMDCFVASAPRNDNALIQRRISRRRNRPARKQWQPSLRAKRSNPSLDIARSTMDCFVASAPRNDDAL